MAFYVVLRGNVPGIYMDATEALKALDGFENSYMKTFKLQKDAENFWHSDKQATVSCHSQPTCNNMIEAYVDGSYDRHSQKYSYGIVLLNEKKEVVHTMQRVGANKKYIDSHQIAGEVFGALAAIQWAIQQHAQKINIHYDYMGIEMWATKRWQAKKAVSKDYVTYFDKLAQQIEVTFTKVKAHSGDEYNELADQLAKEALADNGKE
ncbi:ribonuclease H family protein [Allofustis seminis]|uniref:ribonuclease H family protein n=1 Tax=Allofustis seminis TaxID=166939 RepID=UPI00036983B7|nr:ribonuclease H family protein [Allofustis seminis]